MRLIAAAALVVLVSSASIRRPPPPPNRKAIEAGKNIKEVIDAAKIIESHLLQLKAAKQQKSVQHVSGLIARAEWRTGELLRQHAPASADVLVSSAHQVALGLRALLEGQTSVDSGLQEVLSQMVALFQQLGVQLETDGLDVTTPESFIDKILEQIKSLVDKYLPLIGPIIGLTLKQALEIKKQVDKFVGDVEALEHGQVPVTDGLEAIVSDILEVLRILGVDWTAPTDDSPTVLDGLLKSLESALDTVLNLLGPILGLSREQIQKAEADIDTLIKDIEAIEHGHIDIDGGLEKVLMDIVTILHDFGAQTSLDLYSGATTEPSIVDLVLEELKHIVDTYLPIIGRAVGLTKEQYQSIIDNFDKFVVDIEGMEHGTIEIANGVIDMCIDILHVLEAFGVDITVPSTDAPTTLDEVLFWLERGLNAVLDVVGPFIHLDYDQTKKAEADIHILINDIRNLGDGLIDVDGGLEIILHDMLAILGDFGVPVDPVDAIAATEPSAIDKILGELKAIVDRYLPMFGPAIGLTQEQIDAVVANVDKFVADAEALEHGTVDVSAGVEAIATDLIEILRALGVNPSNPTDDTPTDLDGLLAQLESALNMVLDNFGPALGLTDDQIKAAEADIDALIKDIEAAEHGHIDIDTALEKIVTDVMNILKDLGAPVLHISYGATTEPTPFEKILEQLKALVDQYLPILGPMIGLTGDQVQAVITNFDKFVKDAEALNHQAVDVSTGIEALVTDLIEILKAFGINPTMPTDDTPTTLDGLLAQLESALKTALDTFGPTLGLTDDQIKAAEADIDTLIKDIEAAEHGHIDIDTAIEKIVTDLMNILKDFGAPVLRNSYETTTEPSPLDEVLEELKKLIDQYLPVLGPMLGLTDEQAAAIVANWDKFVADAEALEHGQVDISTGLEGMVTDMLEIFKVLGLDYTNPTDDTPTSLDELLQALETSLGIVLDIVGSVAGLTPEQIQQAEADIHQLITDLEAIEHGHLDVDGGLEAVLTDIFNILKDFGAPVLNIDASGTTTPKSTIDTILDELKHYVDTYLPLVGPILGLTREQTKAIRTGVDMFVADVEGMEHGTVEIATGTVDICINILHILEAFNVDVTVPSTDGTTTLDEVLLWVENGLNAVLDVVGPFIGLDYDQTKQCEADIHTLVNDIRALGDGHIDVDHGLEAILNDILTILKDFGIPTVTDVSMTLDEILKVLEEVFDVLVVTLGPQAHLTPEQIQRAESDFHALIATIEGLEHRDIEAQTGAERIVRELMQVLADFGFAPYIPTSSTPTELDLLMEALRGVLDGALEVYGPRYNLDPYTISLIEADFAEIETHIREIEHGYRPLTDGLVQIVDDVFNMLRDFGVPVLNPGPDADLNEKAVVLKRQLETLLKGFQGHLPRTSEVSGPSLEHVVQLQNDLMGLGLGVEGFTLNRVAQDMMAVARQFVDALA